jgi:hypothetical protein
MSSSNKLVAIAALAVIVTAFVPIVKASSDEADWPTIVTFHETVQVGDLVLTPGTYEFQLTHDTLLRNVVMIYSVDRKEWDGMVMGMTAYRTDSSDKSTFAFQAGGQGAREELRYWFNPGWSRGVEFLSGYGN